MKGLTLSNGLSDHIKKANEFRRIELEENLALSRRQSVNRLAQLLYG